VLLQALGQLPPHDAVRVAMDGAIAGPQHLLVVSLVVGRRAVPLYWRVYDAAVLQGRMPRYELAVIRWAVTRVLHKVGRRRVRVGADRSFADVALCALLSKLRVAFIIRQKLRRRRNWQKARHSISLGRNDSLPAPLWYTAWRCGMVPGCRPGWPSPTCAPRLLRTAGHGCARGRGPGPYASTSPEAAC
jgi:hypothetical protein